MARLKIEVVGMKESLATLKRIEQLLIAQNERTQTMATSLDALAAEVEQNSDVVASAERVLDGLVQQLQEASGNQEEIDAITAQISEQRTRLATAIANVGDVGQTPEGT